MIGKLTGLVDSVAGNSLVLDVNGVGYLVSASTRTLAQLGTAGSKASLLIETHVREEAITLFGFADVLERHWFRLLTSVQGVGPKAGLAILSALSTQEIALAIAAKDKTPLTRADGVGPKLAERIVSELKSKAGDAPVAMAGAAKLPSGAVVAANAEDDAVLALIGLGYQRVEAFQAVARVRTANPEAALPQVITLSLKELAA